MRLYRNMLETELFTPFVEPFKALTSQTLAPCTLFQWQCYNRVFSIYPVLTARAAIPQLPVVLLMGLDCDATGLPTTAVAQNRKQFLKRLFSTYVRKQEGWTVKQVSHAKHLAFAKYSRALRAQCRSATVRGAGSKHASRRSILIFTKERKGLARLDMCSVGVLQILL